MYFSHMRIDQYKKDEIATTLAARDYKSARDLVGGGTEMDAVVRRLTPTECSRLQGFPDGWVDIGDWTDTKGKVHKESDSVKYKALGNAICIPGWRWLARRIAGQYERTITMGSLFAGIGGFELAFKQVGAIPRWSAEIEEFPIAVLKRHFGDEEEGIEGDVNQFL